MKIKPFGDNILVKKIEKEQISAGGVIMPQVGKDGQRNFTCEVIDIGPKAKEECEGLEVGDVIMTGKWHMELVLIEGSKHGCIKPAGIIGKVVG